MSLPIWEKPSARRFDVSVSGHTFEMNASSERFLAPCARKSRSPGNYRSPSPKNNRFLDKTCFPNSAFNRQWQDLFAIDQGDSVIHTTKVFPSSGNTFLWREMVTGMK